MVGHYEFGIRNSELKTLEEFGGAYKNWQSWRSLKAVKTLDERWRPLTKLSIGDHRRPLVRGLRTSHEWMSYKWCMNDPWMIHGRCKKFKCWKQRVMMWNWNDEWRMKSLVWIKEWFSRLCTLVRYTCLILILSLFFMFFNFYQLDSTMKLCCISKYTMKQHQNPNWKLDLSWIIYGSWKCMFIYFLMIT